MSGTNIFKPTSTAEKALGILAGGVWILGRGIARDQYELALRAKTPRERARHQDMAHTYNLWSNVGFGLFAWEAFKMHPKAITAVGIGSLVLWKVVSAASLPDFCKSCTTPRQAAALPEPSPMTAGQYPNYAPNNHW